MASMIPKDVKELLIINPNMTLPQGKFMALEPPIWCAMIASVLRKKGIQVSIWDGAVTDSPKPYCDNVLIVAAGQNPSAASTSRMTTVAEISKFYKKAGARVYITGIHPLALPARTINETEADAVIDTPSGAELQDTDMAAWDLLPDMDKYMAHNWHCLDGDDRHKYVAIYTGFGCPFNCYFCNIHMLYRNERKVYYRDVAKVIKEIDYLVSQHGLKNLKLCDELFVMNHDRVSQICDLLIDRNYSLNIWAYARVDTMVDPDLLYKMKKAGFNWLAYGFESGNSEVRYKAGKHFGAEAMQRVVNLTHKAGINIIGNFLFGLPGDNKKTMAQTLELAKQLMCEYANFYCAMAYPGSQLYTDAVAKNLELPAEYKNYCQFEQVTPLATEYLTSQEILEFRDNAFREYFTNPDYLKMIKGKFGDQGVRHIDEMLNSWTRPK
jgi:radical SAM superfamily enzyme YgiQ (UPF0313 family)